MVTQSAAMPHDASAPIHSQDQAPVNQGSQQGKINKKWG